MTENWIVLLLTIFFSVPSIFLFIWFVGWLLTRYK